VPHVYCRLGEYAIDVIGFTVEKQILDARKWNVHPFSANLVTPSELEKYYVYTFPCPGLYANDSFMFQAGLRANKRITDCSSFYDGTIRTHPFLEKTTNAEYDSIFNSRSG
jgi:hypothetical protein